MRVWIAVGLALVIGVVAGIAAASWHTRWLPYTGNIGPIDAPVVVSPSGKPAEQGPPAKVVVDSETYEFGTMDTHSTKEHDFVFRNVGAGPLKLTKGATGCKCIVARLDDAEVPPEGVTRVTIQWHAKGMSGTFSQQVAILTNDPDHPRVTLGIKGNIVPVVSIVPKEGVVFSRLSAGETTKSVVRVYGYKPGVKLELKGFKLDEGASAKFFDVTLRPLTADEVKEEKDAKCGHEVQITVKPGLPVGTFQQRITLQTDLDDAPTIEIPIKGSTVSDISVTGPSYSIEQGMLHIGSVTSAEGAVRTLQILVRGPYCKEVKFEPEEIYPSHLLRVKVGQTKSLGDGSLTVTPLTVEIPKGSPPANHFGSDQGKVGHITLKTHHPQSPELRILVRFVIEG